MVLAGSSIRIELWEKPCPIQRRWIRSVAVGPPAAMPGYLTGRRPSSKGRRYPPDPPRTEEIIAVMRCCGDGRHGERARGLIAVLWRAGYASTKHSISVNSTWTRDAARCSCAAVKAAAAAKSAWTTGASKQLEPWLQARAQMPIGPLFCVINGPSRGRAWNASAARAALHRLAARAGVRRRFAPHQLRHAHALELLREGVPLNVIQRQLGHRNLGVTSIYLQGIDPEEIIQTVHARRPPMIPASMELALPRGR